jgi:hypothetical protein
LSTAVREDDLVDLYALPPEEFTAARDAAARQDPALKALRRPTVSAWVVNTLVRQDPALVDELVALGASLADAQQDRQGQEVRALTEQRRQLVSAVTDRAVALAGRDVSAPVRAEVAATLEAALADPASAAAVRSGQLVRALAFAGFGGVDLEGAVAPLPRPAPVPRRARSKGPDTRAAEQAALTAAGALDDAVQRAEAAERALAEQQAEADAAHRTESDALSAVGAAQEALQAAEAEHRAATRRLAAADTAQAALVTRAERATHAVAEAQDAADAARAALDALRRSG